jgi:hypothetical protein
LSGAPAWRQPHRLPAWNQGCCLHCWERQGACTPLTALQP